jgi:hypothetical protein
LKFNSVTSRPKWKNGSNRLIFVVTGDTESSQETLFLNEISADLSLCRLKTGIMFKYILKIIKFSVFISYPLPEVKTAKTKGNAEGFLGKKFE